MSQIEQLITSLGRATSGYTQMLRRKLNVLSDLVEEGEEHLHLGRHNETKSDVGLSHLKNYKVANDSQAEEALRSDLYVDGKGAYAFANLQLSQVSSILPPILISPATDSFVDDEGFYLTAHTYFNYFGFERKHRQFQLTNESDIGFLYPILDVESNTDRYQVGTSFNSGTVLRWRCRDVADDGSVGGWSNVSTFGLSVKYGGWTLQPTTLAVSGGTDKMFVQPTLYTSEYIAGEKNGTLTAVEWEVLTTNSISLWNKVTTDTNEFTSIKVNSITLTMFTDYIVRVRFKTTPYGWGEWRSLVATAFVDGDILTPYLVVSNSVVNLRPIAPLTLSVSGVDGNVYLNGEINSSGTLDNHVATRYEILELGKRIWFTETDDVNKLKMLNIPYPLLEKGKKYSVRVKYLSSVYGWSLWKTITITTSTVPPVVNVPIVTATD